MNGNVLAIGSVLALLAGGAVATAAPAAATSGTAAAVDAGPVIQNSRAMAAADDMPKTTVRQQLSDELAKAGFTDVTITPSSFYIHAKNKQGDPVAMVIGPDGFTEVTEVPGKAAASGGGAATKPAAPAGTASKP